MRAAGFPPQPRVLRFPCLTITDHIPPFGKNVLACSNLAVTYFVAYVSSQDGKWYLSSGDTPIQQITHWMPLPEMPEGSAAD